MGSSFSVHNNINRDVWIQEGPCLAAIFGPIIGLIGLASLGAGAAGLAAALGGTAPMLITVTGTTGALTSATLTSAVAGTVCGVTATQSTVVGLVLGASSSALGIALGIEQDKAAKLKEAVKEFTENNRKLLPGESYSFSGTLSLVRTVTVMSDECKMQTKDLFTGPTADSNNYYSITKDFRNLC